MATSLKFKKGSGVPSTYEAGSVIVDSTNGKIYLDTSNSERILIGTTDYNDLSNQPTLVKTGGDVTITNGIISVNDNSHNHDASNLTSGTIATARLPAASGTAAGITIVYPAASCTTFSSDSGTVTPAAVQKGAKQFAIPKLNYNASTHKGSTTVNTIPTFTAESELKESKITIEDVTNTKDTSKTANVLVIPAEGGKKMVYGYCTDQTDGTSFIGGVFDQSATSYPYAAGLAIGGTSGNLLWKGAKVATINDIPTYSAGTGISLSGTTFSNSGVRSISTGSSNGTISVNTNGTSANVAVKGLGSAAYTASTAYRASSWLPSASEVGALPTGGGTMTGNLTIKETKNILLRPSNANYTAGIGYDTNGNECFALWAKNSVTRLRWHAGTDMTDLVAGTMMSITPDFEVSKASGTAIGYIGGNTIIHSGTIGSQSVNYANSAGSANSVAWGNVSGKPDLHSTRFTSLLLPTNATSISSGADLNTIEYLKVGTYYCSSGASVITNHPYGGGAFIMYVLSPIQTYYDSEPYSTWIYRIRVMITLDGDVFTQSASSGSTAGSFSYSSWHKSISSKNISSQSVSYANSAGSAASATTATTATTAKGLVLSSSYYGATVPSSGTAGQVFLKTTGASTAWKKVSVTTSAGEANISCSGVTTSSAVIASRNCTSTGGDYVQLVGGCFSNGTVHVGNVYGNTLGNNTYQVSVWWSK